MVRSLVIALLLGVTVLSLSGCTCQYLFDACPDLWTKPV